MASFIVSAFAICLISTFGSTTDSAVAHNQCDSDQECPSGYFCYDESHYCTLCVDCTSYKRRSSWRSCPKTPSDCGACIQGFEEEILHEGKTRDICVPSMNYPLGQTNVSDHSYERYLWAAGVSALLLPIAFYAFCRKRDRGTIHHGLPREEPPPYRSIELTTLTANSVERLSEENHELRVRQQKDILAQAHPFRQPDYESELFTFDNINEVNQEEAETFPDEGTVILPAELHDENTMPSDWTPAEAENGSTSQLMTPETEIVSESEDSCEPASKRYKTRDSRDDEPCNTQLNINLFINNNVTIHKPS